MTDFVRPLGSQEAETISKLLRSRTTPGEPAMPELVWSVWTEQAAKRRRVRAPEGRCAGSLWTVAPGRDDRVRGCQASVSSPGTGTVVAARPGARPSPGALQQAGHA